jgi:hypothetical protein
MQVVSESYQKYDNGAVSDQLTNAGREGNVCWLWEHRVPGFLSSRPNWLPLPSYPQISGCPPPLWFLGEVGGGGNTCLRKREGVGGPNSDEGTDTVVL